MNKKWFVYVLILVLGVILFFTQKWRREKSAGSATTSAGKKKDPATEVDRNRGFDRRTSYIEYTQHAKCRMQCRNISQDEVKEIMEKGKINYNKSNVKAKPCPSYALEGITRDDQRVRIVFGQCDLKTKIVTVIDLDTEWSCDCPGEDDKYKKGN